MFETKHSKMQPLLILLAWISMILAVAFWLRAKYRVFQLATKKSSEDRKLWMTDGYRYQTLSALLLALASSILFKQPLWEFLIFYSAIWAIGVLNIYLWGKRPLSKWTER